MFQLLVTFPERLQVTEFTSCSEALVEFARNQRLAVGAKSAVVEQIDPNGSRHAVARWESPL